MDLNLVLQYFDKLNDENAMYIEFRTGERLLIDCDDIIRAEWDLMEIKSTFGVYVTESSNITGLRIINRVDLMAKVIMEKMINAEGDE